MQAILSINPDHCVACKQDLLSSKTGVTSSSLSELCSNRDICSLHIPELSDELLVDPSVSLMSLDTLQSMQVQYSLLSAQTTVATDTSKPSKADLTAQLSSLNQEMKTLKMKLFQLSIQTPAAKPVQNQHSNPLEQHKHSLLHDYNDLRDFAHKLLDKIALARGVTIKSLYPEFDIDPNHDKM
ncbi:hypothetical protein RCL1_002075 [Eukaryota sp. TZLM3-RCL]